MKEPLIVILAATLAFGAASSLSAQDGRAPETAAQADGIAPMLEIFAAGDVTLDDFLWVKRPILVFADSPNDPRFAEQIELLSARPRDLLERDVVVITDTDPDAMSDIRKALRPRGFQLAIIGKDGEVELRKPFPWDVREISRTIDKMPLRQREIRENKAGSG